VWFVGLSKERVGAFTDGVFAIAITLLVLTIAQPAADRLNDLGHQLFLQWPSLAAYVVSFAVIGIMWVNHHTVFAHVARIDRGVFYLNLVLLMTIVFIPYPTGVLGEALRSGQGAKTAAVFYSASMTVNALAWTGLWLYAAVGRRLLQPGFPEAQRSMASASFVAGGVVYAASIGVALVNPYACLAFHAALALYYAFDPISRRVGRGQAALAGGGDQ
jgi:uncharacterized membrane protein